MILSSFYLPSNLLITYTPSATSIPATKYLSFIGSPNIITEKITPNMGINALKIAILLIGLQAIS
jgi:hypothetical protein